MELALPLLALGGVYVISKKQPAARRASLPPSPPLQEGFGRGTSNGGENTGLAASFPGSAKAAESFYNQEEYQRRVNAGDPAMTNDIPSFYTLSGEKVSANDFIHNNMTPFNGGKVRGRVYNIEQSESMLDQLAGQGSQQVRKVEQAPLFQPQEHMQWSHGMPNQSDFLQSRVNPSMKIHNVKPFDSIQVAPGLNQGYGVAGSGGLNAGMEARELWQPKTVDELRVETNPKMQYTLTDHQGPAYSFIRSSASTETQGRVEKNRPDTYFENTPNRWLTTTGSVQGPTLRAAQETGNVRRSDDEFQYMGPAEGGDKKAMYAPQLYAPAKRHDAVPGTVNPSTAMGHGDHQGLSRQAASYHTPVTHRATTQPAETFGSGFRAAVGAVVAPIMDLLKPTRKEELVDQARPLLAATGGVPKAYVYNPLDSAPTTIRESTMYAPEFQPNYAGQGVYLNTLETPDWTHRDTTQREHFQGAGGYATGYGSTSHVAAQNQRNNDIKAQTIASRTAMGGTQVFSPTMNVQNLRPDTTAYDGRLNPAHSMLTVHTPSVQTMGQVRTNSALVEHSNQRLDPGLLQPFLNNPYTHSLSSVA